MMFRSRTCPMLLMIGIAATVAACHDGTAPIQPGVATLPSSSQGGPDRGRFGDFTPIAGTAVCVVPPATLEGFDTYKPFVVPEGYSQRILATEIEDFRPVAGTGADLPDMMTLNEGGPQPRRYMYRTHEVGSNGAVTVTDIQTGVTTLVTQEPHDEALDGIVWTPWNTLLFAEERIIATRKGGARSHEGMRFDSEGNLYGTEEPWVHIQHAGRTPRNDLFVESTKD